MTKLSHFSTRIFTLIWPILQTVNKTLQYFGQSTRNVEIRGKDRTIKVATKALLIREITTVGLFIVQQQRCKLVEATTLLLSY